MKFLATVSVLAGAVATVLGQTIDIGIPTDGTVLFLGQNFTAQILRHTSIIGCIEVGIALAVNNCNNGVCPQPDQGLGIVFYAGPFTPTEPYSGGFYQNFTLQVPTYVSTGPAIFTLTHLCLIGAGPYPLLEYRNASVTLE